MLEQLAEFQRRHGHCRVSIKHGNDRKLGVWVNNQRQIYRQGKLPAQRRKRLLALGVSLNPVGELWDATYKALVKFRREHGHINVSRDRRLRQWVNCQRML